MHYTSRLGHHHGDLTGKPPRRCDFLVRVGSRSSLGGLVNQRPLLIVISTGPQKYREYLFSAIQRFYRLHLINTQPPTWESKYLVGSTVIPSTDIEHVSRAAQEIAARATVSGVLSWDEARIHQAATVAEELGLPTTAPDVIWKCRDKLQSRFAFEAASIPQPQFALVGTYEEASEAAGRIGYPVVIKPRAAAASYGVALVDTPEDLRLHFGFAAHAAVPHMPDYEQGLLVEEYLPDPEISIDSVVFDGTVQALFVGHKQLGFPPYFEEVGHIVSHTDPILSDAEAMLLLQETHTALGFTHGWTHSEFKCTPQGLKVIEVNARLGGDLIPYLGFLASGIDPGLVASAVACGRRPEVSSTRSMVAGVRFFYPPQDDTLIDSVSFSDLPPEIDSAVVLAEREDLVSPPPKGLVSGRLAFATAVADSDGACTAALESVQAGISIAEIPK